MIIFLAAPSEVAFAPICRWLNSRLMRYFSLRGCDNATAEELTQDVLFTVFRQAATVRDHETFLGWVYAIARNCLRQRLRSARRRVQLVGLPTIEDLPLRGGTPPATVESNFQSIIATLNEDEQQILRLRFVDGLDYREIASALQIPVGTAKWRVFSTKLKLGTQLRNHKK